MGFRKFFIDFVDTYKETKRRDASYYSSYDNSKEMRRRRQMALDSIFSDIDMRVEDGEGYIELSPWICLENGVNPYEIALNEREYFEAKGFNFKIADDIVGKKIVISW